MRIVSNSFGMGSSEICEGGTGGVCDMMQEHLQRGARLEDELSRHGPVRGARKRIEIRAAVNLTFARHDLRRHECGCPWQESLCGQHTRFVLRRADL